MNRIAAFVVLFISWVVLSGKFDLFHLILGSISCAIVAFMSTDILFQVQKSLGSRLVEAFRFVCYSSWLFHQIALANIHVINLAISTKPVKDNIDPHIFTFKTSLQTDFAKFILANSITLTPGTVTIRVVDDIFYIHAITDEARGDLPDGESVSEMERRIAWVFEPDNYAGVL